jgi:hypothetical protein
MIHYLAFLQKCARRHAILFAVILQRLFRRERHRVKFKVRKCKFLKNPKKRFIRLNRPSHLRATLWTHLLISIFNCVDYFQLHPVHWATVMVNWHLDFPLSGRFFQTEHLSTPRLKPVLETLDQSLGLLLRQDKD